MKRICALLAALSLFLTGCWEAEGVDAENFWEMENAVRQPVPEVVAVPSVFTLPYLNNQAMDPVSCADGVQQVIGTLLYEGLFVLDEQFDPQPLLCSSYSRSANGLTYTFTLRDGVSFSNGAALTVSDVLATYRRAQISERYSARFENVASMRASRNNLIITLRQANSAFPALLDIPIVKSGTEKDNVPLGTGPYLFLTDADGPCLVRNENWWNGAALSLERIALAPAKDADTAAYLFSAKNAHLLTADLFSDTSAASLSDVDIMDVPTSTLLFMGCNSSRPALADAALRKTLNLGIDRSAIVETLLTGHAAAASFPISPASPLYPRELEASYEPNAYEPALLSLLPESAENREDSVPAVPAVPDPVELTLLVNAESGAKAALAEYLARELSAAYITVTPLILPWAEYLAALESGNYDLWLGEIRLTADWNITALAGSRGALNFSGYSNPAFDAALTAFLAGETPETARAFCALLAEDMPFFPLAFKSLSILTPAGVIEGIAPTASQPLKNLSQWQIHLG